MEFQGQKLTNFQQKKVLVPEIGKIQLLNQFLAGIKRKFCLNWFYVSAGFISYDLNQLSLEPKMGRKLSFRAKNWKVKKKRDLEPILKLLLAGIDCLDLPFFGLNYLVFDQKIVKILNFSAKNGKMEARLPNYHPSPAWVKRRRGPQRIS